MGGTSWEEDVSVLSRSPQPITIVIVIVMVSGISELHIGSFYIEMVWTC